VRQRLVTLPQWRIIFGCSGLVLAAVAYGQFSGNQLDDGFWYWIGGIFYFLASVLERPEFNRQALAKALGSRQARYLLLALVAIVLIGVFFRTYRLAAVPAEMTSDHAEKLLDVNDVLKGQRPIFFPRNTGREGFQFYLTAALISLTPLTLSHLALKAGTAIFGILTVPLTYLLGRELYGRHVGLLAAFFLAISHWHVAITRVGLRFPFTAAFATPALFFLLRALRSNRRNDWLAAGLCLGLGLHTYTAIRIVPVLFVLLILMKSAFDLIVRWRGDGNRNGEATALSLSFWHNGLLGAVAAILVFLPLLRYMQDDPGSFWYRATSRATGSLSAAEQWRRFWSNTVDALLMFNYRGDVVPANTIPEAPVLGLVSGGLFVVGCAYLLWRLLARRERQAAYVLVSIFVLLLPSILSLAYPGENPSVVRTGGAPPFVMIAVAIPLVVAGKRLIEISGRQILGPLLLGGLLLGGVATADNYHWYFVEYDAHYRLSAWNASEIGAVVREYVDNGGTFEEVYHVPYPHWVDTRNIGITAGNIEWRNAVLDLSELESHAAEPGRRLYVVHPSHSVALQLLHSLYPHGELTHRTSERPGKDYMLFYVPATLEE
jgi:4-amino-4-deoxy-L-arabinose transferase-like glycosyltransferase